MHPFLLSLSFEVLLDPRPQLRHKALCCSTLAWRPFAPGSAGFTIGETKHSCHNVVIKGWCTFQSRATGLTEDNIGTGIRSRQPAMAGKQAAAFRLRDYAPRPVCGAPWTSTLSVSEPPSRVGRVRG